LEEVRVTVGVRLKLGDVPNRQERRRYYYKYLTAGDVADKRITEVWERD